ncbi:AfsR/SARP family transcriptional regulator [Paractinoplanes maris]|uniref:AfsR/SARP family transcriptional regulator n=1 Tax=Paractinoplanes maris TaxID=1734446 RepID=UPI0020214A0C|nr:BTAD domain-containing putative transcriptional regulator [Actinoplanes maris]
MGEAIYLQVLGPLRLWRGDTEVDPGPHQQRAVLALLAARGGQPVGMSELIDLIWGHQAPPSAVNVIHKYVGALRRVFEPGLPPRVAGTYVARLGNGYRFRAGPENLDLIAFRGLVAEARAHAARDEAGPALDRYTEALRLGHGPAGDGVTGATPARAVFAGLDNELSDALVAAAAVAIRLRRPALLLTPLRQAAERDPLNEDVQAGLVSALAAAGHQAEAVATYRSVAARLADELGIDPGPGLREAYRRVLTQTVLPPAEWAPGPIHPAQLPPDRPLFAGREGELAALHRLADRLRDPGRAGPLVVAVDGAAGTGKSTLAVRFAHLVAAGFSDGQLYLDLRGDHRAGVDESLRSMLLGLGVRPPDMPDTFDARVGAYRSLTAGRRMLVLLDNVCDAAQVRPLLPSSARGLVLLTSRRPLLPLAARDGAHLVRLDRPGQHAREPVERRRPALPGEPCGRRPVALALLAARLTARPEVAGMTAAG